MGSGASAYNAVGAGVTVDASWGTDGEDGGASVREGILSSFATDLDLTLSTLARAEETPPANSVDTLLALLELEGDCSLGLSGTIEGGFDCLRLQNENNPPCLAVLVGSTGLVSAFFSRIRQPTGTTSSSTTFRSLTAISQAVDPRAAR